MESKKYSFITTDLTCKITNISIWDGDNVKSVQHFQGNKISNDSLVVVEDLIIGCIDEKNLVEINRMDSEKTKKILHLTAKPKFMTYCPDNNCLASFVGSDVFLWELTSGMLQMVFSNIHSNNPTQLMFISSTTMLSVDESGLIVCWNVTMDPKDRYGWDKRPFNNERIKVVYNVRNQCVFVITESGKICILDIITGEIKKKIVQSNIEDDVVVKCVAIENDLLILGCTRGTIYIFEIYPDFTLHRQIFKLSELSKCKCDTSAAITHMQIADSFIYIVQNNKCLWKFNIFFQDILSLEHINDFPSEINNFQKIDKSAENIQKIMTLNIMNKINNQTVKMPIQKLDCLVRAPQKSNKLILNSFEHNAKIKVLKRANEIESDEDCQNEVKQQKISV